MGGATMALKTGVGQQGGTPGRPTNMKAPRQTQRPSVGSLAEGLTGAGASMTKGQAQAQGLTRGQQADAARLTALGDAWREEGTTNVPQDYLRRKYGGQQEEQVDPYSEFMQNYISELTGTYDKQIEA